MYILTEADIIEKLDMYKLSSLCNFANFYILNIESKVYMWEKKNCHSYHQYKFGQMYARNQTRETGSCK